MKLMKKILMITTALAITASLFAGCSKAGKAGTQDGLLQFKAPKKGQQIATMKIKDFGDVKIMLFPEEAPKAVENFTTHAKDGYFDGLTFHRVIADFMIQGGDPDGTGMGGESIWGKPFEDEFSPKLRNFTGALSMANSGPKTNGSQFFIVNTPSVSKEMIPQMGGKVTDYSDTDLKKYEEVGGTPWLDNAHTVFGQVYEGMDVIAKVMAVEVDANAMPTTPVIIETIEISTVK
ncbi:MAG: peptidylprolyl isomerase [Oscillospiraceae bacterium]